MKVCPFFYHSVMDWLGKSMENGEIYGKTWVNLHVRWSLWFNMESLFKH